jgi:hypothetical protein
MLGFSLSDGIAQSTHGLNQPFLSGGLNLASQKKDEYVHGIASDFMIISPNCRDEIVSGYDATGPPHEVLQHSELRGAQRYSSLSATDFVRFSEMIPWSFGDR